MECSCFSDLTGYQWISQESLEKKLVESLKLHDYTNFLNAIDRLCAMSYSYRVKEFIMQYLIPLHKQLKSSDVPKPLYDTDGRAYVTTYGKLMFAKSYEFDDNTYFVECLRKKARGDVTVLTPGTGKLTINGHDVTYFEGIQEREQVSF